MYLGIDCGTQGTKALLLDAGGTVHGRGYCRHALIERANGARASRSLSGGWMRCAPALSKLSLITVLQSLRWRCLDSSTAWSCWMNTSK